MKHGVLLMLLLAWGASASFTQAADRVAVIPLASASARGVNKQVQYNDNGRLSGAEMYYDKTTQRVGMATAAPSYLFHVKDDRTDYLVGIHNTSTNSQAKGLLVRADGGDPFAVQNDSGSIVFGIDRNDLIFAYGSTIIVGDLAIRTVPSFTLTVSGTAGKTGGGSWSVLSDQRLKKNIGKIDGALEKITKLQGVSFQWVNPEEHGMGAGLQAGFLAQEVERVFPGWVQEVAPVGKDKTLVGENEKVKSLFLPVDFDAYLVEAIKELKVENEALKELVCADHPAAPLCQQQP